MSRYSGRYYRGAARDTRVAKRKQAEERELDKGGRLKPGTLMMVNSGRAEQLTGINGYPLRDQ